MREYFIKMPFPPSINTRIGTKYTPKAYKEAFERARCIAETIRDGHTMSGSVTTRAYLQKGDRKAFDIQNFSKVWDDGFTKGGLWVDDSLIDNAHLHRLPYVKGEAWVFIHIVETEPMSGIAKDRLRK